MQTPVIYTCDHCGKHETDDYTSRHNLPAGWLRLSWPRKDGRYPDDEYHFCLTCWKELDTLIRVFAKAR